MGITVYLVIIFLVLISAIISLDKNISKNDCLMLSCSLSLILIVFASFRTKGIDYDNYVSQFRAIGNILNFKPSQWEFEYGYELLTSICKTIYNSFHFFLISFTAITFLLVIYVSSKFSPYPIICIAMFFAYSYFYQIMGQMRQPFAILMLYACLPIGMNGNKTVTSIIYTFIIVIILGFLFHKSLFFVLPALFFINKNISINKSCIILGLSIIAGIFSFDLIYWLYSFIPDSLYLKYSIDMYLFSERLAVGKTFSMGMIERIAMLSLIMYFFTKYNIKQQYPYAQPFFNLYLIGICLYFFCIPVSGSFASRGSQVMNYSLFFLYPVIISCAKYYEKLFLIFIFICWFLYVSLKILQDSHLFVPYQSILS
jgi:hypothetical protein